MTPSEKAIDRRERDIYNSSLAERKQIMADQHDACAICSRPFVPREYEGEVRKFTAFHDHDHRCCPRRLKKFCGKCNRGYLCFICNKFLVGVVEKQKLPVDKLLEYVTKWAQILKERGAYEPKPDKPKAKKARKKAVRAKQKGVRRSSKNI